jgi:hypothetical protein
MDEMAFLVLSEVGSSEPFFVLLNGIDWRCPRTLDEFVRTLCRLVESGALTYVVWGSQSRQPDAGGSFETLYQEISAHIAVRIRQGEVLTDVPKGEAEYEFAIANRGARSIESLYDNAKLQGRQLVGLARAFRARMGRYPSDIQELLRESAQSCDSPLGGCGVWWYKCADDGRSFRLGLFACDGTRVFYDGEKDAWVHDLSAAIS